MGKLSRSTHAARLAVEGLEDRLTPAVAYVLSGAAPGVGTLFAIDTAALTTATPVTITGLNPAETLVGIDFRPQNGLLYGLGVNATADTATLYAISTRTGFAAVVGPSNLAGQIAFTTDGTTVVDLPDPATVGYGFDFNPAADRVRVVAGTLNFRVNPNTGTGIDGDNTGLTTGTVTGTNPDGAITGATTVDAAAYTNDVPNNGNITTLYTLNSASDTLNIQTNPNTGATTPVGTVTLNGTTLDFTAINGFDIPAGVNAPALNTAVTSGSGFALLSVGTTVGLYSINLVNGQATFLGSVNSGGSVQGLAVQSNTGGFPAIALDAAGTNLIRFNTSTPTTTTTVAVTGVAAGDTLVGIDFRPVTGQLFGLGVNATADTATLYLIDPQTGAATIVGTAGLIAFTTDGTTAVDFPDPATAGYGFDFNPTVDRIRVTTSTGLNFRVNPNNGAPVDGDNGGTAGSVTGTNPDGGINAGATGVSAAAYTNSVGTGGSPTTPVGVTTLYTLDATTGMLFIQNSANGGTETVGKPVTLNGVALAFTAVNGFDIPAGVQVAASNTAATGSGYATLVVGGTTGLYRINLATGAATLVGTVGAGTTALAGLALGDTPTGTIAFQLATATVNETGGTAIVVLTRTSGTGPGTVTVTVTGGTATAGTDFTAGPYTVTFAEGQTTATLSIPVVLDALTEPTETVVLTITAAPGAAIGSQATTTLTITDSKSLSIVLGSGSGVPTASGYNADGTLRFAITPYGKSAIGGVRVVKGDITGDGVADVVTVNTSGTPVVKAFDGVTGAALGSFPVPGAAPGASLAVGDVNRDGFADIIIGSGFGGGVVAAFSGKTLASLGSFNPFGVGFSGGVSVAAGDLNGDGFADVIAGKARLGSQVAGFSGKDLSSLGSFPAGGGTGGVTLALADLNNDGKLDIITGAATGSAVVRAFSGTNLSSLGSFPVFGGKAVGVNVSGNDLNGDGRPDLLLGTASGVGVIEGYNGINLAFLGSLMPFGMLPGGVYVG